MYERLPSFALQSCLISIRSWLRIGMYIRTDAHSSFISDFRKSGFIDALLDVVHNETNPTVLSNAAASLLEISQKSATITFQVTDQVMKRLITTLPDCTEYVLKAKYIFLC